MSKFDVDYTPTPTGKALITSDKKYSFIIGPVGPVSGDTEFLTDAGWKRVDEYQEGDLVAQWTPDPNGDPTAGVVELVQPLGYIVGPADTMLHFHNKHSLSMMLSPNHRVPYYDYRCRLQVVPAADIAVSPSVRRIPTAFTVSAPGTGMDEAVLRLAVAINADGHFPRPAGHVSPSPSRCVVTVRKERKKQRLRALLGACGVAYDERPGNDRRPTETRFLFDSPYIGKTFDTPDWWKASASELNVIMDELKHWDGLYEGADTRFATTSKGDADFVQYAAHATGGRATISVDEYPDKPNWNTGYTVHIAPSGSAKASVVVKESGTYRCDTVPAPGGKQYCFRTSSSFFLARHNGRIFVTGNSGKTVACLMKILYQAKQQAPNPEDGIRYTRFVVVRNTNRELQDTTLKSFFQWFPPGKAGVWKATPKDFLFKFDDVHCEVLFRPLDTPDDVSNVLSLEITGAMLDEFVEIPREIVDALQSRCGRYPSKKEGGCTWRGMWGASNPGVEDSWWNDWLYEEWPEEEGGIEAQTKALNFYEQPSGFSPNAENLENLPPYNPNSNEYYVELAEGKTPEWIHQFIEVKWGYSQKGKPVYKTFKRDMHVATQPLKYNPLLPIVMGFDAGLTPAATFTQQDSFGRVLLLDELISDSMGARRFCREKVKPLLARRFPNCTLVVAADPATRQRAQTDEKTVAEVLEEELGVRVQPARSNALAARIGAVEDKLMLLTEAGPALVIDPSCRYTIQGFQSAYRYAINTKGVKADTPEKSHPHSDLADAIQYACMAHSEGAAREARRRKKPASGLHSRNTYTY